MSVEDVLIVGAGVAGITAARTLLEEGGGRYSVKILEATDHYGGRSYSDFTFSPDATGYVRSLHQHNKTCIYH